VTVDPEIQSMQDLAGKKVGLGTDEDAAAFSAALKEAGMSEDDVDTAVVGEGGPTVVNALESGEIAAYASTGNVFAILESTGNLDFRDITPDSLAETSSVALVATPETIDGQGEAVEGFLRAMAKGLWAGQANPEGMTEMYKAVVPDDWRDEEAAQATMDATYDFYKPVDDQMIGELIPERWENAMQRLLDAGELEEEVNIDELLDPQFVQGANDFDRAAVEKDLEDWLAQNQG
jgi:NitT/TauT family transport system substrate-binding protein